MSICASHQLAVPFQDRFLGLLRSANRTADNLGSPCVLFKRRQAPPRLVAYSALSLYAPFQDVLPVMQQRNFLSLFCRKQSAVPSKHPEAARRHTTKQVEKHDGPSAIRAALRHSPKHSIPPTSFDAQLKFGMSLFQPFAIESQSFRFYPLPVRSTTKESCPPYFSSPSTPGACAACATLSNRHHRFSRTSASNQITVLVAKLLRLIELYSKG